MPASSFCSLFSILLISSSPISLENVVSNVFACSWCLSIANLKPRPNSALSSNKELFHAGPLPSLFTDHGVVGRLPP